MALRGPQLNRILLNVVADAGLAALAVPLARALAMPGEPVLHPFWLLPLGAVAVLACGLPVGLSRQYWRFAGMRDLVSVAIASVLGAAIFALLTWPTDAWVPSNPAFPVIHALTLLALLGLPRLLYRWKQSHRSHEDDGAEPSTVLLAGAGDGADIFLRALEQDRRTTWRVAGILSLRSRQAGRRIHGHPILGTLDDLPAVLDGMHRSGTLPGMIVVTSSEISGVAMVRLIETADRHGISVRRAPDPTALAPAARRAGDRPGEDGPRKRLELRPVAIEDLLNRPQVPLDREGMARLVQGRRVLVTGAGGTIGSELARQVAALGPEALLLLDNGEYALWQIDLELGETHPAVTRRPLIADIRDEARMRALCAEFRPELVFHAAALKHVPMVEANPLEGLLTNAFGTRIVADAARAAGAKLMVLISTDKAVNPTSVMGASKRLAEMYCQALDIRARADGGGMRCVTVRFGNVLGSTGSVVPLFQRQLERGGPLTVTHPDMQRYFMTVREAVGLVLQASVVGAGDTDLVKDGGIFVLDMGKPVKIVDLARQMVRLAGLKPDHDVEIRFTGLRPGEKLFEELFHGKEPPRATPFAGLLMAEPRTADPAIVGRVLEEIAAQARTGGRAQALAILSRMVPEFEHNPGTSAGAQ